MTHSLPAKRPELWNKGGEGCGEGGRGGRGSRRDAKATMALSFSRDEKPRSGEGEPSGCYERGVQGSKVGSR